MKMLLCDNDVISAQKKSFNHSVSESSTLLHRLCVTSQLLNRMTFELQLQSIFGQQPNKPTK